MKNINYLLLLLILAFTSCAEDEFAEPVDKDGDGYVVAIKENSSEKEDCDDDNPNIHPGATEIPYNGIDDDCDPLTLDNDVDEDGFDNDVDCDDTNAEVNPDAVEIPYNGIDDDCDPLTPDDDLDGDGYNSDVDCDDTNAEVNPGAEEIFTDDIDNNCNGVVGYIETVTVSVDCNDCSSGSGSYYNDSNRRAGRQCAVFDSDSAAATAGFSPCTDTNIVYID